jgi:hypothetical protein
MPEYSPLYRFWFQTAAYFFYSVYFEFCGVPRARQTANGWGVSCYMYRTFSSYICSLWGGNGRYYWGMVCGFQYLILQLSGADGWDGFL